MGPLNAGRLVDALMRRGLTYSQLAEKAGVTEATISNATRGGRVRPSTLRALAKALYEIPVVEGAELIAADVPGGRPAA